MVALAQSGQIDYDKKKDTRANASVGSGVLLFVIIKLSRLRESYHRLRVL